jgi:hypothetical protein
MANQGINYSSRNFVDIRTDLINMVRQYYSEFFNDFNDASIGLMLLELNAAVGDMLSHNTDRMFQETQIDYAQERKSILSLARTFGLKVPGKRPSVTIVDFTVTVPTFGDTFDVSYAPIIRIGSQVTGAGKVFETMSDIDFSSPFTIGGIPNRLILPNFDANGNVINYNLVKREMVVNGYTKYYQRPITVSDVVPFLEVVLPDTNVLSIDSVITLDGTNYPTTPNIDNFFNNDLRWFEVDALAEDKIYVEDTTRASDNSNVLVGKWIKTTKKFMTEYTDLGFYKMIFGSGSRDVTSLCDFDSNIALINQIGDFVNNNTLGETLKPNTTLFVKYRVGGGADTNLGVNVINGLGLLDMTVNGPDQTINSAVRTSLTVNNAFPALGGRDEPSVNELRNLVKYNFASQNRAVTIKDYQARIALMPGRFGVPFRCGVFEEQNKINIYILGLNAQGKLSNTSTSTLRDNIATYLAQYRMLNDYVQVTNGRIINLAFEVDLYIDKRQPQSSIVTQVIITIQNYMNINNFEMGDNIYMSQLIEAINNVGGVLNVIDLRVFNKVGEGKYSLNEISQPYLDSTTRQVDISQDFTLFGEPTSLYEIKFPETDIKVRVK